MADQEDVVVGSRSYHLNIFGFSGAPPAIHRMSSGFVTTSPALVATQSASLFLASLLVELRGHEHSHAYIDDPIASGLIPMAGTALSMTPNIIGQCTKYWYTAASAIGCGDSVDVMDFKDYETGYYRVTIRLRRQR
ncbi:hypothetical protein GX51_00507 [Blastomyces parvus]|uniref:Uncharacterized protein n=1 Tax=Blastomyces parvus TaxID=2060905 RepID=A0A2B7XLK4_9EURO|nr:hypothetical protein GX51_00507 [Blastomyces parvus]